jgi:hypothetical protein
MNLDALVFSSRIRRGSGLLFLMRSLAREDHSMEVFGSLAAACAKAVVCADTLSVGPARTR